MHGEALTSEVVVATGQVGKDCVLIKNKNANTC